LITAASRSGVVALLHQYLAKQAPVKRQDTFVTRVPDGQVIIRW